MASSPSNNAFWKHLIIVGEKSAKVPILPFGKPAAELSRALDDDAGSNLYYVHAGELMMLS